MKVAFINQPWNEVVPPVQSGSIAIWTYEIARRLAPSCHVIVYAKRSRSQKKVEYNEGVHYRHVSIALDHWLLRFLRLSSRHHNIKRPFFASNLYYLGYILQVARDLRTQQCDIVHLHNMFQFVPIIRAFNPKCKIVLHMHCEWLTQLDRAKIERWLKDVNLVIGCSEYITGKIREGFPQVAKRCTTLHNGVDTDHFCSNNGHSTTRQNGEKRLLFVGRISPEKGIHVLLEALQQVVHRYPHAQLTLLGPEAIPPIEFIVALSDDPRVRNLASFYSGSYVSHLRDKARTLGVAGQVSFMSSVPHQQLPSHYQEADVFIQPSVWGEPFPLVVLEAMAAGVPVVATRAGGLVESVEDGKTGLLANMSDAPALAEAILCLLEHDDLRQLMGKAARRRAVELFSWERVAENLLGHYINLCDGR